MHWIGQTMFYSVWEPNTAILYRFADLEELYLRNAAQKLSA